MQPLKRFPFRTLLVLFFTVAAARAETPDSDLLNHFVFDAATKFYQASLTDTNAIFFFNITNTSQKPMTVDRVQTSCGCTVANLPSNPWHLPAGGGGTVKTTVNLIGKGAGLLAKTITFYVSSETTYLGTRVATVKVNIPLPPLPTALNADQRKIAMQKALADPQQIFKDPQCAVCHVTPGKNTWGAKLYAADCGICHDSPNRASFVPDLHKLKTPVNFGYWKTIINNGKPHTMMPAFAVANGGPLNDEQVHSIAEYLTRNFSQATARPE